MGLLNAHNCMGSCMLVKLLPPRAIHHCRVHNWVQAQVVSFASKCFQAWLHYFVRTFTRKFFRCTCTMRRCWSIWYISYTLQFDRSLCLVYQIYCIYIYYICCTTSLHLREHFLAAQCEDAGAGQFLFTTAFFVQTHFCNTMKSILSLLFVPFTLFFKQWGLGSSLT